MLGFKDIAIHDYQLLNLKIIERGAGTRYDALKLIKEIIRKKLFKVVTVEAQGN